MGTECDSIQPTHKSAALSRTFLQAVILHTFSSSSRFRRVIKDKRAECREFVRAGKTVTVNVNALKSLLKSSARPDDALRHSHIFNSVSSTQCVLHTAYNQANLTKRACESDPLTHRRFSGQVYEKHCTVYTIHQEIFKIKSQLLSSSAEAKSAQ